MSSDLASPALHRHRSVISDFRPPSGVESGDASLRRLFASRAIGGYSSTSDDPAPGRVPVARPQDAPKLVSLLSSCARCHLEA